MFDTRKFREYILVELAIAPLYPGMVFKASGFIRWPFHFYVHRLWRKLFLGAAGFAWGTHTPRGCGMYPALALRPPPRIRRCTERRRSPANEPHREPCVHARSPGRLGSGRLSIVCGQTQDPDP